ncbi:MAG: hypothetical protein II265_01280 [Clostridia bacterium]|nr:hypothetical protein [Clostridia bacterium]
MIKISLVDEPAVMSDFVAFDRQKSVQMYSVADSDKRLVYGVVLRADFPIYRRDKELGEYYVLFKPDTIRAMAEKYLADGLQNETSTMHKTDVDGVQMVQYFIKDTARGVNPDGFDEIADGSLFAEFHVTNDDVWEKVKDGTFRGFSMEAYYTLTPEESVTEVREIVDDLDGQFCLAYRNFILNCKNMSKIKRFKAALAKLLAAFGNVSTDKGVLAWDGDEDLKAGDAVYIEDTDGNRETAPDGDYVTSDAKTIVVADGKVSEIKDPEAEVSTTEGEFGSKATDKGTLRWEGEEDLKAGDEVFTEDEEGNRTPAADGDYKTEDGKVIVVVDGKVSEIRDDEAEVATEDEERAQRYARIRGAFEDSYDEKTRRIMDAIGAEIGHYDWYLRTAGDDFAIIAEWDEDWVDHYFRYAVTWNEDGTANVADRTEVKEMFVPIDYEDPFEKEAEELRAQVETLTAKVANMSKEPKGKPAHEEVKDDAQNFRKTGNKGLDKIAALMSK